MAPIQDVILNYEDPITKKLKEPLPEDPVKKALKQPVSSAQILEARSKINELPILKAQVAAARAAQGRPVKGAAQGTLTDAEQGTLTDADGEEVRPIRSSLMSEPSAGAGAGKKPLDMKKLGLLALALAGAGAAGYGTYKAFSKPAKKEKKATDKEEQE